MDDLRFHWNDPPDEPRLSDADVHVWAAALDRSPSQIAALGATLSADERDRAGRYHFPLHRNRFIAGRGILRAVLGSYLRIEPAQLRFAYSPRGKPTLTELPEQSTLHFNVAHSDGLILIAVTRVCPIGIDVERIRLMDDAEELAKHFFSPSEIATLGASPKDEHAANFLSLWTRKEAYLKATGEGISQLLPRIEVSFLSGEPVRVVSILGDSVAAERWTLEELSPAGDFKAAIAAPAKGLHFSCRRWPY